MDKKELAKLLNGREYGYEIFRDVWRGAIDAGLVIVSGASDDLMEFDGAICDESGGFDGGKVFFDRNGVSQDNMERANFIQAFWCNKNALDENGNIITWTYKTEIPHETFMIYDNGEPYCRGIIFDLSDIKEG